MKKEKKKGGRQSDYRPEYCQMVIELMSEGYSIEACAGSFKKSKQTLYTWRDTYPEFKEAIEIGQASCQYFWEKKGIEGNETIKDSDGMTVTRSIPPAIWIFNVKNRFGWRDVKEIDAKLDATHRDGTDKEVKELVDIVKQIIKEDA